MGISVCVLIRVWIWAMVGRELDGYDAADGEGWARVIMYVLGDEVSNM
jgi:hypothetical protein